MKQFLKKAKPIGQIIILALSILLASCAEQTPKAIVSKSLCPEVYRIDALNIKKGLGLKDEIYVKTGAYVLEDGAGSMVARAWLSEYAQKSIDIQYFIFSLDNIGLIACDYLIRAADRGVKVRILIDDIMVDAELIDILKLDSHENISIKIYNPGMNLGKNIIDKIQKITTDFRSANQRMHNKTFIVDSLSSPSGY